MKFTAKVNGKRGEIYLYDPIGASLFEDGVTAKSFAEGLKSLGNVSALDVYLNSPGGSVFEGFAIYEQLNRFSGEKVVHIDGIAASIASVIAMAGTERRIAANGVVMIHDPYGVARGGADEMRRTADALDLLRDNILDTYTSATKGKRDEIKAWMSDETWMDAKESLARGFATSITSQKDVRADARWAKQFQNFGKTPAGLITAALVGRDADAQRDVSLARLNARLHMNRGASPAKA